MGITEARNTWLPKEKDGGGRLRGLIRRASCGLNEPKSGGYARHERLRPLKEEAPDGGYQGFFVRDRGRMMGEPPSAAQYLRSGWKGNIYHIKVRRRWVHRGGWNRQTVPLGNWQGAIKVSIAFPTALRSLKYFGEPMAGGGGRARRVHHRRARPLDHS
jgi:hypothetical protein